MDYQLEQALANVQSAEAQLSLMIKGARKEDIIQAEENLKQTETNLTLAKNDFDRFSNLLETKSITQKQYDEISARYKIMKRLKKYLDWKKLNKPVLISERQNLQLIY